MAGCSMSGCSGMSEPPTQAVLAGGANAAPTAAPAPAPAAAPVEQPSQAKVDTSKWLTGDLKGLNPTLAEKLAQVGEKLGTKVKVVSGFRSREEQQKLYDLYKAGKGNLAAAPGHSNHESGNAADVYVDGVALRDNAKGKQIALDLGLKFPVPSESWHVEVK
jgi:uncharacterized protein YcbK (DUF882 family)